jgi:hypothetical protein
MKLFTVGKVGCFAEAATLSTEQRKGEIVKIAVVTCRIAPFDAKLAAAMGATGVRSTLFKLNHPDPNPILGARIDLAVGCPRQVMKVFPTPDSPAGGMAFDQVRVYDVHAKGQKDAKGFALVFKVSFGPLSPAELEFINAWRLSQRFVTFDEAEPGFFDEEPELPEQDAPERKHGLEFEEDGPHVGRAKKPDIEPERARKPEPRHKTAEARAKAKQGGKDRKRRVH